MADTRLGAHVTDAELRGRRLQDWLLHPLVWLGVALLAGLYVGMHMTALGPRYSKLVIGIVFLVVLFRFRPHVGVGLMLILYAFPARIWIGDTNFIFTVFVLIAWMIRVAMREEHPPRGTYLDWAILAYVFVHLLSLSSVRETFVLQKSLLALRHLFVPIVFYYVMVNIGRSEKRILIFAEMFTISMVIVFFAAFAERFFPQVRFLPSWMLTAFGSQDIFAESGMGKGRIGGLFTHAMLGDATAIAFILQVYLAIRYRHKLWARYYHWFLALVALYVVALTRNRGSLLVVMAGAAYFLFIFNRELNWRRVLMGTIVGLGLLYFGEVTLARFEGDIGLLGRLAGTYFERGIPDTRVGVWTGIWRFLMEKPILGHGPFFSLRYGPLGLSVHWPHNTFLFYWFTTGILGVIAYTVVVLRVFKRTWVGRGLDVCKTSLPQGLTAIFHIAAVQFMLGQLRSDHQRGDVFVFLMWIVFAFGILAREVWEDRKRAVA